MSNDQFLSELQAKIDASDEVSWTSGITSLHGLSNEEFRRMLGAVPPPGEPSLEEREQAAAAKFATAAAAAIAAPPYPPSVDWRNNNGNYVTPVLSQGDCGSCVAFATCATIESNMRITKGFRVDTPLGQGAELSEAQLFFCNNRCCEPKRPCSGWWPTGALDYITRDGVIPASDFPYSSSNQPCNLPSYWKSHITQLSDSESIGDLNNMKTWLANKGPLIATFTVYEDFRYYKGGVYKHVSGGALGGHAVCCIGYDEQMQAWLCKNSWGTGWGERGYFWIGYGQCGIDDTMWGVTGFSKTYFDWMGDSQIRTIRPSTPLTSSSPALAMNNDINLLHLVYRSYNDNSMWWSWFDGNLWRGDTQIQTNKPSTPQTSNAPALVMNSGDNTLYLVYRSYNDSSMWYSWYSGNQWQGDVQIRTTKPSTPLTSTTPSLVIYNNLLYLVYRSYNDSSMWYSWFDGTNWQGDVQIRTTKPSTPLTSTTPSLVVYNNLLYLVYRSYNDSSIWYSWFDGTDWQGDKQIQTTRSSTPLTSATPALVAYNNLLYLLYRSYNDSSMWYSWFDGINWQGDVQIQITNISTPLTSSAPAVAIGSKHRLYLVYRSYNDSSMWWSILPGYVP